MGKTRLVDDVCYEFDGAEMIVVRLHGLVQTDDRIALREIARQLKLENVVRDRVGARRQLTRNAISQAYYLNIYTWVIW